MFVDTTAFWENAIENKYTLYYRYDYSSTEFFEETQYQLIRPVLHSLKN